MVPYEAFLSEKPVLTTTDAGGPLEVVTDGRTGFVTAPEPAELARAAGRLREHPDEARDYGRAGKEIAARVTWDSCIDRLLRVKVAYYSPLPPERSGIADYSAHLLPALRERIDVEVVRRGRTRPARGTDLSLYHVGNNPDAHGWIVDALRKRPGVVVLHDFVLHHLVAGLTIGRRDGHGYLDAMEREGGVVGAAARPRRPRQADPAALGEPPRGVPPRRRGARPRDRPDRPLAPRRGAGARRRLRGPDLADPAPGLGACAGRGGAARGLAADRLLREREREQADPAAARGVRPPAPRPAGRAAAARRRRLARLRPRPAPAAPRPVRRGHRPGGVRRGGPALVADGRLRRLRQPALADDGRDLGQRHPPALARQAGRRQRRRLVRRAAGRGRAQGSGRRARDRHALRGARAARARRARPDVDVERPGSSSSAASTTSAAPPTSTSPRSSRPPAARRSRTPCSATSPRPPPTSGSSRGRRRQRSSRGGSPRSSLVDSVRRVPAWAWLAVIVTASIVFRAWLGSRMPAPFIFTDELDYQENARSLAEGDGLEVRDAPFGIVSVLYPLLLAPGLRPLRLAPRRVRGGADDQRRPDVGRGDPGLPDRAAAAPDRPVPARGAARGRAAVARLHRHADVGERVLPGVPARGVGALARARRADARARRPCSSPRAGPSRSSGCRASPSSSRR